MGRLERLFESCDGRKAATLRWVFTPEETHSGRLGHHQPREVFLTDAVDDLAVADMLARLAFKATLVFDPDQSRGGPQDAGSSPSVAAAATAGEAGAAAAASAGGVGAGGGVTARAGSLASGVADAAVDHSSRFPSRHSFLCRQMYATADRTFCDLPPDPTSFVFSSSVENGGSSGERDMLTQVPSRCDSLELSFRWLQLL